MNEQNDSLLYIDKLPELNRPTLVLAFSGWMDGGDVSTGTVSRLVSLLKADQFAEIEPEPFYIYNFPGSMEIAALFRPHIEVDEGVVQSIEMPSNLFFASEDKNVVLFLGKEPNLMWPTFGDCLFELCEQVGIKRVIFVGSFGGSVPHTREPRMFITCSDSSLLPKMERYGVRQSKYEGPGSFTSYLMTRAPEAGLEMVSLVAEIPGYLQGTNPLCIEAVTRRLSKILKLPLDLDSLRSASTEWELQVTSAIEEDDSLLEKVRELEDEYDRELMAQEAGEEE